MKAAVIGLGRMGKRHLTAVRELGLDVAGVCDRRPDEVRQVTRDLGLPDASGFTDAGELLRAAKPECVLIATTADSHAELARRAVEAGARFVLVEKPMAVSLKECDELIGFCRARGARLAVNHQMRYMEMYLAVRRRLESEAFGRWSSISVVGGNIGLAMNAIHYFELFRWLSGEPLAEISARFSDEAVPNPRGAQFRDWGGALHARTPKGRRLSMEIGTDQGHGVYVTYAGRTGIMVVDELAGRIMISQRRSEDRALPTTRYGTPAESTVETIPQAEVVAPTRLMVEALINGGEVTTGEEGRAAIAALAAAVVSHEKGGPPVPIRDDHLPLDRRFDYA